jgi:hypothetical protein
MMGRCAPMQAHDNLFVVDGDVGGDGAQIAEDVARLGISRSRAS